MIESLSKLHEELKLARQLSDRLFETISPDAIYDRPIPERNRLVFYLGHMEAFDWNVLGRRAMGEPAFHPTFDALFERGIDPEPGKAPSDTPNDWPRRAEVDRYNAQSRDWVDKHLGLVDPLLIQMVIEHRYMHTETFAYLMHNMPYDRKIKGPVVQPSEAKPPRTPLVPIASGVANLGKGPDGWGWDNEYLAHQIDVGAFRMSKFKISNGEYLEFVNETGAAPSNFWVKGNGSSSAGWSYRGMFGTVPLPLNYPAWVTWQQAAAYASWRGLTLPSEAQYQLAASRSIADPRRDNFDFQNYDPVPVDYGANGNDVPVQLTGNGWEWTRDVFAPFPGFQFHPFYPGYSQDFFDQHHYVMKGASPRTAAILTRSSFRNWFRLDYPHMYAGFHLVED